MINIRFICLAEKTNEITGFYDIIKIVDIKNSIITGDAMFCQREIVKTIIKELLTGCLNGLLLGILAFGFVFLFLRITNQGVGTAAHFEVASALKCAGIVGFSLFSAMVVASFIGTTIPIIFYKIKIDPAVASGPFITTINDIVALLIYYGLAMLLFSSIL